MNILDENIINNQCQLLKNWRILFRQIGYGIGSKGIQDKEIITLLHSLRSSTFFTRDDDFFSRKLCHSGYCLVYLAVKKEEAAVFIRRFLRNKDFNHQKNRLGKVIKISHSGLLVWKVNVETPQKYYW